MNAPPPPASPLTAAHTLQRLVDELTGWGDLFLRFAREDRASAAEQVLGGLVDWMGNGLMEGWLHLPIPRFEAISDLAEELREALQAYLARLQQATPACSTQEHMAREAAIRRTLERAQELVAPEPHPPNP